MKSASQLIAIYNLGMNRILRNANRMPSDTPDERMERMCYVYKQLRRLDKAIMRLQRNR